jgi:hypothetical protein
MAKVVVIIQCQDDQADAVPEAVLVRPGDRLVFNFGRNEGTVTFPAPGKLFKKAEPVFTTDGSGKIGLQVLNSAEIRKNLGVADGRSMAEGCPYEVHCTSPHKSSHRDSAPVIIIEESE